MNGRGWPLHGLAATPGSRALGVGVIATTLLAIAYFNALTGAFVFDDEVSIVENSSIRRLWPLSDVLAAKAEGGRTHDSRPLLNLSLAMDYAAHGLWRPGFRLVNLAIHLCNVLFVFDVARRILRLGGVSWADAEPLAGITATLWAVHPLHTAVNTYVIQRAESMAAFFILAAFDVAIVALARGSISAAAGAGAIAILGATAKETTAAILPLVAVFDWAFHDRLPAGGYGRRVRPVLYAGLALNVAAIIGLAWALGGRGGSAGLTTASVVAYALTQCLAIWLYVGKLFWPATLVLDHGEWLASGPADVWPFVLATAALAAGLGIGFWRRPQACFPLVAAAILLAPTTSIVPVKTQTIAEHRMYLPAAFLIGWLATAVARATRGLGSFRGLAGCRGAGLALVAALAAASVTRTIVRNRDFQSAVTLWQQNVRDCPRNDRGVTNLVAALIREGRLVEASPLARQVVTDHPERDRNWLNIGRILAEEQRNDEAAAAFAEAIRLAPGEADARINLGIVLSRGADREAAIAVLDDAIRLRPDLAKGWLARGMVRLRQERPDLAVGDLEVAVQLDPENPAGWANLEVATQARDSREASR